VGISANVVHVGDLRSMLLKATVENVGRYLKQYFRIFAKKCNQLRQLVPVWNGNVSISNTKFVMKCG
jgi:hypothetical protein